MRKAIVGGHIHAFGGRASEEHDAEVGLRVAACRLDEAVLVGRQLIGFLQAAVGVALALCARHELIVCVSPPLTQDEIAGRSRPSALAARLVSARARRHIPFEERNAANRRQHPDCTQELS